PALIGAVTVVALLLAACAGPPGPAPAGLGYEVPDPNPATYSFSDSTAFSIESGVGRMEVLTTSVGTAELEFRDEPPGYRVEVRFPRLDVAFETPAQGAVRADEADVDGPVVVRLGARGDLVVVDTPALGATLAEVTGPEGLVRPLFVQLPGRPVREGARWVDTVTTREESGGTVTRSTSVITSVLLGDTIVEGRRLLRIRTSASHDVEVTGVSGGVDVEQRLTGESWGRLPWDEASDVLFTRFEEGELTGTLTLPGTGAAPLPVTAWLRRDVSLRR
ncbi:MAG: hypothetical protein ACOCUW_04635, partial [Gemmatimonadota bacterium]